MSDDTAPETPTADPAWVVGPGPEDQPPAASAMAQTALHECAACHAKTLDWVDKPEYTCWVCGRVTRDDGTLVPRPEPGPDEEYNPR